MAGWSKAKREKFEEAFYAFLNNCFINSKNTGFTCLGENLYDGQIKFIDTVLDGLEADIHKFYVLKSRQLGLSTISRALSVFYIGVHKGISGALVFDTAPNRELARAELETMIDDLPAKLKFPAVKATNREGLTLVTKSKILFKAAGVKKSAGSGGLGRSAGLSMAHMSELCSFTDPEGLESFENSLSEEHPDRLYIYESTARGYNLWEEIWRNARADTAHCSCLFLGWWSHPKQEIGRDDPDFARYGLVPPTNKELEKIKIVRERYGVEITPEKLAWIRRKMNPSAVAEGDADPEFEGNSLKIQEQPWTEEEAFQQTGSTFFPAEVLSDLSQKSASNKFSAWMFLAGSEFVDMKVLKAPNTRNIDLKIWEDPDPDGVYAMGVDPAFGSGEYNDRSAIEIYRCYADGLDQVAEYASPLINTRQLAWVMATLLGYYGAGPNSLIKYALELNGPGAAVFNEIRNLRNVIDTGYQRQEIEEKGLQNIFRNVRTYIYTRPDSMGIGNNFHIKTTGQLKVTFLERLRDFVTKGTCRVRSLDLLSEMKKVSRDGDRIQAEGSAKDDRVLASSFVVHVWETGLQRTLMTQKRTREAEAARKRLSIVDQVSLFQQNQLQSFFDQKRRVRVQAQRMAIKQAWRYR